MKHTIKQRTMNKIDNWRRVALIGLVFAMASCGSQAPEAAQEETPATDYAAEAIADRGEPCACVDENIEAMQGLVETIESASEGDVLTAMDINVAVANQMLPCMKPTGELEKDRAYSRAMGACENFTGLTDLMTIIKNAVQEKMESEQRTAQGQGLEGVKGANDILDKLKGN